MRGNDSKQLYRLFLGIPIPLYIREELIRFINSYSNYPQISWIRKVDNFHITLHFLGDTSELKLSQLITSLSSVKFDSFNIAIEDIGCFPNWNNPKVIWTGVKGDTYAIDRIYKELSNTIRPLGFREDKKRFHPHVTIARVKNYCDTSLISALQKESKKKFSNSFLVDKVNLYESILDCSGSIYNVRHYINLDVQ